jgi:uncharacterized protein (TIGR02757 family)
MKTKQLSRQMLESAYELYNDRQYVHPDPLEFVYRYGERDREVVALLAASLAYGRVQQILKSVADALCRLGDPLSAVTGSTLPALEACFKGYKHRFTTGEEVARMLFGAGRVICSHGSLGNCFRSSLGKKDDTVLSALAGLVRIVSDAAGGEIPFLLPSPEKGSACKRLNLFVRWMVRSDQVDPGGWAAIPAAKLIVPLDTHMHRVGVVFGLTKRKSADMRTALDITMGFRRYCPEDPVKYDFALTRSGILRNWQGKI